MFACSSFFKETRLSTRLRSRRSRPLHRLENTRWDVPPTIFRFAQRALEGALFNKWIRAQGFSWIVAQVLVIGEGAQRRDLAHLQVVPHQRVRAADAGSPRHRSLVFARRVVSSVQVSEMVPARCQLRLSPCGDFFFRIRTRCDRTLCRIDRKVWDIAWTREMHANNGHRIVRSRRRQLRKGALVDQMSASRLWFVKSQGPQGSNCNEQNTDNGKRGTPRRVEGPDGPSHQQKQQPEPHKHILHSVHLDAGVGALAARVRCIRLGACRTCKAVGRGVRADKIALARDAQCEGCIWLRAFWTQVASFRRTDANARRGARRTSKAAYLCAVRTQDARALGKRHGGPTAVLGKRTCETRSLQIVRKRARRTRRAAGHAQRAKQRESARRAAGAACKRLRSRTAFRTTCHGRGTVRCRSTRQARGERDIRLKPFATLDAHGVFETSDKERRTRHAPRGFTGRREA